MLVRARAAVLEPAEGLGVPNLILGAAESFGALERIELVHGDGGEGGKGGGRGGDEGGEGLRRGVGTMGAASVWVIRGRRRLGGGRTGVVFAALVVAVSSTPCLLLYPDAAVIFEGTAHRLAVVTVCVVMEAIEGGYDVESSLGFCGEGGNVFGGVDAGVPSELVGA
jgi:hypothetical protein